MRFAVIIALVCSRLVNDMYRFCFNPIIMLFRQDRTNQANNSVPVRENAHHISTPANLTIQPLKSGYSTRPWSTQPWARS
ncbi:hypothetical protein CFAEC_06130 [Corynebacterium faecale]|nr:hypothetical protein CFAEC_06130 [Corynebacterium faecale]